MEDNYEIQRYMIRPHHTSWAVIDTKQNLEVSYHETRPEAVETCQKLRDEELKIITEKPKVNWIGPLF